MVSSSLGTTWRSDACKPVRILLSVYSYHIPSNAGLENVWQRHSKSAHFSLCSSLLYMWTVTFVQAWICTYDMWASRLQAKGQRGYFSQKIGLAVARSAGPALPPLTLRLFMFPITPLPFVYFWFAILRSLLICSTSLTVVKFCPSTGVSKHFLSGCNAKCFAWLH